MKLYTRTGDDGSTGLFGGQRVPKDHARVEAYGAVDETNAALGVAASLCDPNTEFQFRLRMILHSLQSRLFDLGADLATPEGSEHEDKINRIESNHCEEAEAWIDEMEAGNSSLRGFILPGGTTLSAQLHVARSTCRRAERRVVTLDGAETINPHALVFLNRVSDLLFAMARRANSESGYEDVPWEG